MTVEDLIRMLQNQPKDRKVFVRHYTGKLIEATDTHEIFTSVFDHTEKVFVISSDD